MKTSNLITGIAFLTASAVLAAPIEQQDSPAFPDPNSRFMKAVLSNMPYDRVPDDGPVPEWDTIEGVDGQILGWVINDDDPTLEDYCRRYLKQHKVQPGNVAAYTWPFCRDLLQRVDQGKTSAQSKTSSQSKGRTQYIIPFPNNIPYQIAQNGAPAQLAQNKVSSQPAQNKAPAQGEAPAQPAQGKPSDEGKASA
ncbi:hypothetical protein DIS24_g4958 [Lasiodiplodia hormozganensis]|uniref:Uncharacterized protein n=1 Tax=Lasiodiplodia hormozganensis TaxID=869390 RepID=A0AA40D2I1_9PEZI|nr:hypothetical protein DIS24_g4958 [Lasiodiplodia hormozganensis]